jgi:hypothetical protein
LCKNLIYNISFYEVFVQHASYLATQNQPHLFFQTMYFNIFNKIENRLATTCGDHGLPLYLNYATKSMPYNNTIYKVVVESWYCQNIQDLWENYNGIKEGTGM